MHSAKISVVIPLYNKKEYIISTLESVREQSFQPFEIIIVDDNSTDGGPDLAAEYARDTGLNIRIIRNKAGKGVSGARNTGADMAHGDYIAFLDSDDLWLPQHLERLRDAAFTTRADIVCTDFDFFGIKEMCDENVRFFKKIKRKMLWSGFKPMKDRLFFSDGQFFKAALRHGFSLRIQASAVHKQVFHWHNVWFDENISFLEDHQFYFECAYKHLRFAYLDEITARIRKYRDESCYDKIESHLYRFEKMKRAFDPLCMTVDEQAVFNKALYDMGFLLVRGQRIIRGETKELPEQSIMDRAKDSIRFYQYFPSHRGLREAIKNVIGSVPSRFVAGLFKKLPPAYAGPVVPVEMEEL